MESWLRVGLLLLLVSPISSGRAETVDLQAVRRGWEVLTEQAVLPSDFSQQAFDEIWQSWPAPLREQARESSVDRRREMAMQRYGLTSRPDLVLRDGKYEFVPSIVAAQEDVVPAKDPSELMHVSKPMQYVVDAKGAWTMNCLSCHGGSVYGTPTPGAPNNRYALQTLTEEIRSTKFRIGQSLGRMELGSLFIPLGTTHGTTNAVVFGMGLMQFRDSQLNVIQSQPASFTHHDMDAPPWWYFHKRPYLYIDGFAEKGHRGLMQFTLVPENDAKFYRDHEDDFRDVFAFLESLRAPRYDGPIDQDLANQGRAVFEQSCADCHGTYDASGNRDLDVYPNLTVPIAEIGTDPVRWEALSIAGRQRYADSWFAHAGETGQQNTRVKPAGYVAPPLDGVWASPPYFHNGSVPTLWHVLHPEDRPTVWRRTSESIDAEKIGFQIEIVDRLPLSEPDVAIRRSYFDTSKFGKSNSGHDFPNVLSESEKAAVLEYLKTL